MGNELLEVLTKFHREVVLPDIQRIVSDAVSSSEQRLRDEIHTAFDALAQRLDRLETEYHMLVVGLKRVEERLDKMALRSDLQELKARVDSLQEQVRDLEARLEA